MKKLVLAITAITFLLGGRTDLAAQPAPGGVAPIITEIMYNPPEGGNDTLEFLEIFNPSLTASINMAGYYFSSGIEYTFPAGYSLGAEEYVILSGDSVIFETWYDMEAFEWTGGTALSNDGEGITLRTAAGAVVDTIHFDDTNAWADADATGYSLVLCDVTADNNLPESWTLSENPMGFMVNSLPVFADPGEASTCTPTGINEENAQAFNIYPNPSNGDFSISMDAVNESTTLRIFNSVGQMVHTEFISAGTDVVSVSTELRSGHYILSIENGTATERHKFTVNR